MVPLTPEILQELKGTRASVQDFSHPNIYMGRYMASKRIEPRILLAARRLTKEPGFFMITFPSANDAVDGRPLDVSQSMHGRFIVREVSEGLPESIRDSVFYVAYDQDMTFMLKKQGLSRPVLKVRNTAVIMTFVWTSPDSDNHQYGHMWLGGLGSRCLHLPGQTSILALESDWIGKKAGKKNEDPAVFFANQFLHLMMISDWGFNTEEYQELHKDIVYDIKNHKENIEAYCFGRLWGVKNEAEEFVFGISMMEMLYEKFKARIEDMQCDAKVVCPDQIKELKEQLRNGTREDMEDARRFAMSCQSMMTSEAFFGLCDICGRVKKSCYACPCRKQPHHIPTPEEASVPKFEVPKGGADTLRMNMQKKALRRKCLQTAFTAAAAQKVSRETSEPVEAKVTKVRAKTAKEKREGPTPDERYMQKIKETMATKDYANDLEEEPAIVAKPQVKANKSHEPTEGSWIMVNSFKGANMRKDIFDFLAQQHHDLDEALFVEIIMNSLYWTEDTHVKANKFVKRWRAYAWKYDELKACSSCIINRARALSLMK